MEFVNKMKKEGKLIMGIGHRVKSVSSGRFGFRSIFFAFPEMIFKIPV